MACLTDKNWIIPCVSALGNRAMYSTHWVWRGKKKVSDFLNAEKVPTSEKSLVYVLEDAAGRIVWVVGYRVSDSVALSQESKEVLLATISWVLSYL